MFLTSLISFLILEGVSLLAFQISVLSPFLLLLIFGLTIFFALRRPEQGIYILFAELFIGSRGHLLDYHFVSLRLVVFTAVFFSWLINDIRRDQLWIGLGKAAWSYWLLFLVIVLGALSGYLRGNASNNIFYDVNGYLYLAILPAVVSTIKSKEQLDKIFEILKAAILVIAAKTLLLFLWFSLGWPGVTTLYHWVINQDIGEITGNIGQASRIFMQSQIWALVGVFIFSLRDRWLVVSAALLALIMSLSRSLWLGGMAGAIFGLLAGLFLLRSQRLRLFKVAAIIVLISAIEGGAFFAFSRFVGRSEAVGSRVENPVNEAAGGARIFELTKLLPEIGKHPVFGSGFGTEVTFPSFLPEKTTTDNPQGNITTYAFEWGYLDMILKVGFLGFLVYLIFIARIFSLGIQKSSATADKNQNLGVLSGLVALVVLNITTPYLNHPLGIGYLILAYLFFQNFDAKTAS